MNASVAPCAICGQHHWSVDELCADCTQEYAEYSAAVGRTVSPPGDPYSDDHPGEDVAPALRTVLDSLSPRIADELVAASGLRWRRIPPPNVPWDVLVVFGRSYDTERLVKGQRLSDIVEPVLRETRTAGRPPEWAGLESLRAALSVLVADAPYLSETLEWNDDIDINRFDNLQDEAHALLDAIRTAAGSDFIC